MTLDERARHASDAILERGREVRPHQAGLERKPWVAPVSAVGAVLALVAITLVINRPTPLVTDQVETAAVTVSAVPGPILGAFVDDTGEITVLSGDVASPSVQRLRGNAGAPVLGVETVPEPRWLFDGRVIEYVSEVQGELQVVRVDVRTGLTTHEPYWVGLMPDGGISESLDDEGTLLGRIALMSGGFTDAYGPSVATLGDGADSRWRLRTIGSGQTQLWEVDSIQFVAPTADGLIVVHGGALRLMAKELEMDDLDVEGVTAELTSSVAAAPGPEVAFGLIDGTVVVSTGDSTQTFSVGNDPVTGLSWDPSGEIFIAETTPDEGTQTLHVCVIASNTCDPIQNAAATPGKLVRGIPTPLQPELFFGFWPENTQPSADAAVAMDDAAPWRFDAELLVAEFASVVLGWQNPAITQVDGPTRFPYFAAFELQQSTGGPITTVSAGQLAGAEGWVITRVFTPIQSLRSGFSNPGPVVSVGFDRQGAATVDVVVSNGPMQYFRSTDDSDEVEFLLEEPIVSPGQFLVLFKDEEGAVFAANSGTLNAPMVDTLIG